jgi:zinc protease
LTEDNVNALSRDKGQVWLDNLVASAPIEAAVVGDIEIDRALELVRRYLGSLPGRAATPAHLDELRQLAIEAGPLTSTVHVPTITPRAVVFLGWRGANWTEVKKRRLLSIASEVLSARLREEIREERGLTYSIHCYARPAQAYPGNGFLGLTFTADPEKASEAADAARQVVEDFARQGPTAEEMETVRKQFANIIETSQKEPTYWASVMSDMDYRGTHLWDVKQALHDYTSYTRADMMEAVADCVREDRRIQVIALPEPVEADAATP